MVKYFVTKFNARNVANLRDFSFETNGNVLITGQNGAGKSTVKKALMWILNGSTGDGEKLINPNFDGLPFAEVTLSDGSNSVTFGKEITQKVDDKSGKLSRSTEHFFNGLPAKQKDFQAHFEQITSIFPTMIDLFCFGNLSTDKQRAILLNLFSNVTDADVKATDDAFNGLDFRSMTPDNFKKSHEAEIRKLKARAEQILAQIDSLQAQLADTTNLDAKKAEVEKLLAGYQAELNGIDAQLKAFNSQADRLRKIENERFNLSAAIGKSQVQKDFAKRKIADLTNELKQLRLDYSNVREICPTCGQLINGEKAARLKAAICEKGTTVKAELEKYQNDLKDASFRIDSCKSILAYLQKELDDSTGIDDINALIGKRNAVSGKIADCHKELAGINTTLNYNTKTEKTIADLQVKHKKIGGEISKHEYQADLAGKFIQRKMDLVTSEINRHFQHVGFNMFETLKSGEIKQVCDATLNGVSYDNLSKGEKLFASLDIINAFQNHFNVMLPLIIDDAESYTSNTLINVPNQKILFKVIDNADLEVACYV